MCRKQPAWRYRGVTLIEALVVMAVLAVLASLGVPAFQLLMQRQRVDSAIYLLSSHLATARMTAITYRSIIAVCPADGAGGCRNDSDWSQGWLMFRDSDGNRQPDDPEDVLRQEVPSVHPMLRIVSTTGRQQVRYLPDGRNAGSNLTVRFCHGELARAALIVNNAGRIRTTRDVSSPTCPPTGTLPPT